MPELPQSGALRMVKLLIAIAVLIFLVWASRQGGAEW
jgi:hypothetical protein